MCKTCMLPHHRHSSSTCSTWDHVSAEFLLAMSGMKQPCMAMQVLEYRSSGPTFQSVGLPQKASAMPPTPRSQSAQCAVLGPALGRNATSLAPTPWMWPRACGAKSRMNTVRQLAATTVAPSYIHEEFDSLFFIAAVGTRPVNRHYHEQGVWQKALLSEGCARPSHPRSP